MQRLVEGILQGDQYVALVTAEDRQSGLRRVDRCRHFG